MAISKETIILEFKIDSKGVITNVDQINSKLRDIGTSAKVAQKGFADMNSAAGIAGSTVTEFGRLISDMPYGIQGVANNLSQLGSMFSLLVVQAGNMNNGLSRTKNVINLLGAQILGPVGILVAFQGMIALLEVFSRNNKDAADSVDQMTQSFIDQRTQLELLRRELEAQNLTDEERADILERYGKVNADLAAATKRGLITQEMQNDLLDKRNSILQKEREIKRLETRDAEENAKIKDRIEKLEIKRAERLAEQEEERRFRLSQLTVAQAAEMEAGFKQEILYIDQAIAQQEERSLVINKERLDVQREIDIENQKIDKTISGLLEKDKESKKKKEEEQKVIVGTLKFYETLIGKLREQQEETALTTEEIQDLQSQIEALEIIMDRLRSGQPIKAENVFEMMGLEQNVGTIIEKTVENTRVWGNVKELAIKGLSEALDPEQMQKDLEANLSFKKGQLDMAKLLGLKEQAEKIGERAALVKNVAGALNDVLSAQADREIAIEKNKTTALNDQLKRRLANENLSAEERDKINQQISRNEADLVEKQNKIAKKQFQREKALKIIMALSDTASSAVKAYLSQFVPIPDPTSPARGFKAAAVATAFGLAQVAAISRLKYTEQGLPSPNLTSQGGGGAPAAQGPAFNIVGASGQSQLAQLISGQTGQPIKAYVVAGEVTTAQSLERNKIAEASI